MRPAAVLIIGMVLLALLGWATVDLSARAIEDDLAQKSRGALDQNGFAWAGVAVDGRDAVLEGMAPDADARDRAMALVDDVFGVRRVLDRTTLPREAVPAAADDDAPGPFEDTETAEIAEADAPSEREPEAAPAPEPVQEPAEEETLDYTPLPADEADPEASACETRLDTLMENRTIEFAWSSAELLPSSFPLLDELAAAARQCPEFVIEVSGHADNSGEEIYNVYISGERAKSVVAYLKEAGIKAGRLRSNGYGSARPIADNATREGRARNRRIEFTIVGRL